MNQVYRALERLRAMLGADFTKCIALFFLQGGEVLNGCL